MDETVFHHSSCRVLQGIRSVMQSAFSLVLSLLSDINYICGLIRLMARPPPAQCQTSGHKGLDLVCSPPLNILLARYCLSLLSTNLRYLLFILLVVKFLTSTSARTATRLTVHHVESDHIHLQRTTPL